jgi:hypothetical protein
VIGIIVAANQGYLGNIGGVGDLINLVLAVVLWPLLLFGVDFNIKVGGNGDNKKASSLLIVPVINQAGSLLWSRGGSRQ